MRWLEFGLVLALALGAGAGAAKAQEQRIDVELMVSHVSGVRGEIDPRGRKLHQKLQGEFRYESLRVLQVRGLRLALNEVGSGGLPNGKTVRPLSIDCAEAELHYWVRDGKNGKPRKKGGPPVAQRPVSRRPHP